jgi:3-oxoacyl-[acyl-carrier protein] reductase
MMLRNKIAVVYGAGGGIGGAVGRAFAREGARVFLAEMANVAAFMASDQASGVTGTNVNLTMGTLDD